MLEILPVAITVVDWHNYLLAAKEASGHTVTQSIDRFKLRQDVASFIISLKELQNSSTKDPAKALREAGSMLRHASATFLCVMPTDTLNQLREEVDLAINSSKAKEVGHSVVVISGNLLQWRSAVVDLADGEVEYLTLLSNKFMACFESAGLGQLWSAYSKTPMNGPVYRLVRQ